MKITYFINQYPQVSHTFIRREILALEKQGFNIQRIALRGWNADIADEADKDERTKTQYILAAGLLSLIPCVFRQLLQAPWLFGKTFIKALRMSRMSERNLIYHIIYLFEACKVAALCREFNSQHIHAHFGTNSTEVALLAHLLSGIPYSFTVHGPEEFDKPLGLHLKEKVAHAKFVVAISSYGRAQLYRWAEYNDWHKIKIVHCGLDDSFLQGKLEQPPVNKIRQLLCIGRLCEQKGQLLLLQALQKVIEDGESVKLILAGDGEMRPVVETFINNNDLQKHVQITGWISSPQVKQLLMNSDAMILPSFAEGLPVAIMEAMAIGTPVLTTYIAGIPELIISDKNGILFPAGDIDATRKAILEFLSKPEDELILMREQAYQSVDKQHNIAKEAAKLACYFKEGV